MHPRFELDDVIHAPIRLSIMAALAVAERADFAFLRDSIQVSDSLLSKHVSRLESAGYVAVTKGYEHRRPRTWFALTATGRAAFSEYQQTLRRILHATDENG